MLYLLVLTDAELSYEDYSEDFYIGFFETKQQAEETAQYYLQNVKGFCDFPCTYHIAEKEIDKFNNMKSNIVWMVQGYNTNENLDETDIIESQCFLTKEQAESELKVLKSKYQRTDWSINNWIIGELYWHEGFVRI